MKRFFKRNFFVCCLLGAFALGVIFACFLPPVLILIIEVVIIAIACYASCKNFRF